MSRSVAVWPSDAVSIFRVTCGLPWPCAGGRRGRLRFDRAGRSPEHARIDPIRIALQHPFVELLRGRRRFGDPIEVADVLPSLFDDPRIVVVLRPLVPGDD